MNGETRIQTCTLCAAQFAPGSRHDCPLEALNEEYRDALNMADDTPENYARQVLARADVLTRSAAAGLPGADLRLRRMESLVKLAKMTLVKKGDDADGKDAYKAAQRAGSISN
jgi:hypothetical protein